MILNVYAGNLGLPSVDIKSLQMMAYAKFTKMDIKIVKKTFKPYTGCKLPELICEKGSITDLEDYIEYLKFEACGSNLNLNNPDLIKLDKRYKPYEVLFQETLKPALLNTLWVDDKNYVEITRGTFAKVSRFPFNYIVPNYLRKSAIEFFENLYPLRQRKKYFEIGLIEKAKEVLRLLSENLGESKYFNSKTPNEIDALIFGYLAVIFKMELPKLNNLHQFINQHKNLIDYVNRILREYFPEELKTTVIKTKELKEDSNFEVASWKSIFFFTSLAIASNLVYIFCISLDEEDDAEEEY